MLKKIAGNHFKNLKEVYLEFRKNKSRVFGTNATGKTSMVDLVCWVLTGKDRFGRSDFEIKPREDVEVKNHVTTEGMLEFDGLKLKKSRKEKWTQKRGYPEKKLTGHEFDYEVNGKEVSAKKYNEIIDESFTKNALLYMIPTYFGETMHWKDRMREVTMLVDTVSDEDVFAKMDAAEAEAARKELLENDDPDEAIKSLNKELRKTNKKIKEVNIRIDECNNKIPEIDYTRKWLEGEKEKYTKKKTELEDELKSIESGSEIQKAYDLAVSKRENAKTEFETKWKADREDRKAKVKDEKTKLAEKMSEKATKNTNLEMKKLDEDKLKKLKKEKWTGTDKCDFCGSKLSAEKIAEAKKKYNTEKAEKMDKLSEEIERYEKAGCKEYPKEEAEKDSKKIVELTGKVDEIAKEKCPEFDSKEYDEAITKAETDLNNEKEVIKAKKKPIQDEIDSIDTILKELAEKEAVIEKKEQYQKDVKEHIDERDKKLDEHTDVFNKVLALESYIVTKARLYEPKLREIGLDFILVEEGINGGVSSTCKFTIPSNGNKVPFETANFAAQMREGAKMCEIFQKRDDIDAPIFIDNAESIVDDLNIDRQLILATVNAEYDSLTVIE